MRALKFPGVRVRGRPPYSHFVSGAGVLFPMGSGGVARLSFPAARRSPRVLLNFQLSIPLESSSDPPAAASIHPQQRGNHLMRCDSVSSPRETEYKDKYMYVHTPSAIKVRDSLPHLISTHLTSTPLRATTRATTHR